MKLITYCIEENEKVGVLTTSENSLYPIEAFGLNFKTMLELIENITSMDLHPWDQV